MRVISLESSSRDIFGRADHFSAWSFSVGVSVAGAITPAGFSSQAFRVQQNRC
jgi:hypothetical protein